MARVDWLWKFEGQLRVIATPYHKGKHYATHPKQLVPIVKYLENLHNSGYVHGDIRAYNMVLKYENSDNTINRDNPEGWLIDFDFGGLVKDGNPKYPSGYTHSLDDGFRRGEPGKPITFDHDWFALGKMIFEKCYILTQPKIVNYDDYFQLQQIVKIQQILRTFTEDNNKKSTLEGGTAAKFLCNFLEEADNIGFTLTLVSSFETSLRNCHLFHEQTINLNKDSKGATGSPEKNSREYN